MGRMVKVHGPRSLLPMDDRAQGMSGEGGMMGDVAGTVTGDRSDVGSGAESMKHGEAGCCAMGADMGRGNGGTGATGGMGAMGSAKDNGSVDEASEAWDQG